MISSYNGPSSFMALTLPPTTALNPGWTIGLAGDNGKVMSVQVNGTPGGLILMPSLGGARASLSLALQADGNYLYFCAAPNTWKRAAGSSF
jgi:hypothetical protein